MLLSYCIAAYFGNDRHSPSECLKNEPTFYIKKQIEGLQKCNTSISKIYIVCTFANDVDRYEILSILNDFTKKDERIIILTRDNLGGSYCSWQYCLWYDDGYSDYIFLVEDDYILDERDGIDFLFENYFAKELDIFYLCQYWSKILFENLGVSVAEHAAMSCGIINNKIYDEYRKQCGIDFKLEFEVGYVTMWRNQACFLENHKNAGLKIIDWTKMCSSYFPQHQIEYGNPNGRKILKPIQNYRK